MRCTVSILVLSLLPGVVACKKKTSTLPTDKPSDTGPTGDDDDDDDGSGFVAHVIDELFNPVFATVGDVDGDGAPEIIVSSLGMATQADIPPGVLSIYKMDGSLDSWTRTDIITPGDGIVYPNQPTLHDVDGDGDSDIILGVGGRLCEPVPTLEPCGGLMWLENAGGAWPIHSIVSGLAVFYTSVVPADFDGDGNTDWITTGERYTVDQQFIAVEAYRGLGNGNFALPPVLVALGGGEWPAGEDLDGDGDLDVMLGEKYDPTLTFSWIENPGNFGAVPWQKHTIADNYGPGFMIRGVDDLFGDGQRMVVATNHTNTQSPNEPDTEDAIVIGLGIPNNPTGNWTERTVMSEGIVPFPDVPLIPNKAPGSFAVGDADDDGDLDVVVAGGGDPTVYLLDQTSPGIFVTRVLAPNVGSSAGTVMRDLDGDGDLEIVVITTRDNAVFVIDQK